VKFYKATFPNGATLTRSSARDYSHAWGYQLQGATIGAYGFSRTQALANNAARGHSATVVPVELITGAEYRAILKANKEGAQ
jgi:hypothetical protein